MIKENVSRTWSNTTPIARVRKKLNNGLFDLREHFHKHPSYIKRYTETDEDEIIETEDPIELD